MGWRGGARGELGAGGGCLERGPGGKTWGTDEAGVASKGERIINQHLYYFSKVI